MNTKKVLPYPIDVQLLKLDNPQPIKGLIRKLTSVGFLVDVENYFFKVGEEYKCEFTIPSINIKATEIVKVIKTMDRFKDTISKDKVHLIEFHFKNIQSETRRAISQFTTAIHQSEK